MQCLCQDDVSLLNILTRKKARKKRNVGQRWLVGWINAEREKHTRGQAAGPAPAPGRRETRGRLSGF